MRVAKIVVLTVLPALGVAACGSSAGSGTTPSATGVGALSAEAQSAATGDIPDNQVFLTFASPVAGYSISYPEGWIRKGAATDVTFVNNNNIVHVVIAKGAAPSQGSVRSELVALSRQNPSLKFSPPRTIQVKSGPAVKTTYTTESAPNPVTGKSVLLVVDRYELSRGSRRATVDLATPKGVDNVDAYRMMINSFRWR